jgi:hypothetical protein
MVLRSNPKPWMKGLQVPWPVAIVTNAASSSVRIFDDLLALREVGIDTR